MASITIFILALDFYFLFSKILNGSSSSTNVEITATSVIKETSTEFSTAFLQITQSTPTKRSTHALLQTVTETNNSINLTPTLNQISTSMPTITPPPQYFTNEWDNNTSNWKWFSTSGNDNLWDVYNEAGVLVFSLLGKDTNAYFIYTPWEYKKVTISTKIEVRSKTKSSTVIICNYSEVNGWYEFDIGSDGLWEVRLHDTLGKTGYLSLVSGGSVAIQTGEGLNEYSATCIGNHLNLSINGTEVLDFTDIIKKYEGGKIGLGILSYSQVPILVESAWVKIIQP